MVLTEEQLHRIRDPERSPSVGRIDETPEEAEARQQEAYDRGAIRGFVPGTVAKDEPGTARPEPDSPVQVAAEREFVEKTINKSGSDLLAKSADKIAIIDQIRARINDAGDRFVSFNVTGRANEIIGEINKAAEKAQVSQGSSDFLHLNLGSNTATRVGFGESDKGIITITDVTPQYFSQIGPDLKAKLDLPVKLFESLEIQQGIGASSTVMTTTGNPYDVKLKTGYETSILAPGGGKEFLSSLSGAAMGIATFPLLLGYTAIKQPQELPKLAIETGKSMGSTIIGAAKLEPKALAELSVMAIAGKGAGKIGEFGDISRIKVPEIEITRIKGMPSNRPLFGESGLYPKSDQVVNVDNIISNKDITKINKIDTAAAKQFDIGVKSKITDLTTEIMSGKEVKFTEPKKLEPLELYTIKQSYADVKKGGFDIFRDLPKTQVEKVVLDIEKGYNIGKSSELSKSVIGDLLADQPKNIVNKLAGEIKIEAPEIKPFNKMPENPKLIEWKPKLGDITGTPAKAGKGLLTLQKTEKAVLVKPQLKVMQLSKQLTTPAAQYRIKLLGKQGTIILKRGKQFAGLVPLVKISGNLNLSGLASRQKSISKQVIGLKTPAFSAQLLIPKSKVGTLQTGISKSNIQASKSMQISKSLSLSKSMSKQRFGTPQLTIMRPLLMATENRFLIKRKSRGRKPKRSRKTSFFGFPRATLREVNISDIRFGKSTQPPKTRAIFRAWKSGLGLSVSTKELLRGDRKRKA